MRTILTSGVRPRIGRSQSILSSGSITSTRRSAVALLKRKLTLCDAFTVLLAPVLTAAFVADITQKDKRRQQWEQKIAQIQSEINELKEREAGVWSRLQMKSIHAGIAQQRRCYSTTVSPVESDSSGVNTNQEVGVDNIAGDSQAAPQDIPIDLLANLRSYENCLAQKVGLQLLLHLSTGVRTLPKLDIDMPDKQIVVPDRVDKLLKRLSQVQHQIFNLKPTLSELPANFDSASVGRKELDAQISELTWQCRTGLISVTELAYRYTHTVMSSQVGPSLDAYQNLVKTLSTLDQDILTGIAMSPYLNTRQVLSDDHVGNIIQQYGKVKDPARLERFLNRLTKPEGFAIATAWEFVTVNGVRIPVPLNRNTALLDILTRSALQGDQPHKAQAWALLLLQQPGISAHRLAAVFNNFLTYCAKHMNWADGKLWLYRSMTWIALLANDAPWTLQKLIHRMLDLCMACEQTQEYEQILSATVLAGIDVPPLDETRPDALSDQARKIRADWAGRIATDQPLLREQSEFLQAAIKFQIEMAKINSAIQEFVGVTDKPTLEALTSNARETSSSKSLQRSQSTTQGFQPWAETHLLSDPEAMLTLTSNTSKTWVPFVQQAWDETSLRAQVVEKDALEEKEKPELQEAYDESTTNFDRQHEILDALPKPSSTNVSESFDNEQRQEELQILTQQLFTTQSKNASLKRRLSLLQDKYDYIQDQNDKIDLQLAESKENQRELLALNIDLQSRLAAPAPKSLEAVFLEKENMNIRFEMRTLSARYLAILGEKEKMQNEVQALYAQLEGIKSEDRTAEMNSLQRENQYLREQLITAEERYESSVPRLNIRRSNFKSVKSALVEKPLLPDAAPYVQEEQYERDRKQEKPIKRFTLRSRKPDNDGNTDGSRSPFWFSSS